MAEVRKYDHSIFHHPGDEGSESSAQGKTYSGADCPNDPAPLGGSHDPVNRPGDEGTEDNVSGPRGTMASVIQGYQDVPPASMEGWLSGPEVRKTYVPPTSGANPYPAMPQ